MILRLLSEYLTSEELITPQQIHNRFTVVAEKLLNNYTLVINHKTFRLTEIEFYYYHPEIHPDPFVHRDILQKKMGIWYFHKTGANYRLGTFKGMDITFGDETIPTYGGILVRATEEMKKPNNYTYGPSKCVDVVLKETGVTFDQMDGKQITKESCPILYLEDYSHTPEEVLICPRVGLPIITTEHLNNMFRYANYRYIIYPQKTHKGKVSLIAPSLLMQGYSKQQINELLGYRVFKK